MRHTEPEGSNSKQRLTTWCSVLSVLGAALLAFQCEDQASSIENRSVQLIPMAVGNQWHYQSDLVDSIGNVIVSTNETIRIFGDTLVGSDLWFGFSSQGYRMNRHDGVWQLVPTPYLEFPMNIGDSVLQRNGLTYMRLISKGERITVPAGSFVCFAYTETNPRENNALVNRYYVAPSLGLVRREVYSVTSVHPYAIIQLLVFEIR